MNEITLNPEVILLDGERIQYRSQVRFRLHPDSSNLAGRLRQQNAKQVIWDDSDSEYVHLRPIVEKGECWPEREGDMAILQLTYSGPRSEAQTVKMRHDLMVPAHVRGLLHTHGYAEIVSKPEFK